MELLRWMSPRDPRAARRSVWILCAVAAAVTVVLAPLQPDRPAPATPGMHVTVGVIALILGVALLSNLSGTRHSVGWALCPLLAVAAIVVVDLLTADSSVAAQILFIFPTLYGASQLPPPGAVIVTTASVAGAATVVGVQLPLGEAAYAGGYVAAALITSAVLLSRETARRERLIAHLEHVAARDPLTDLATRRVFDEKASRVISHDSGDGVALILVDIDNFKTINDRFGHPRGDLVLVDLADLLRQTARADDLACRLGGDELAVLLPDCSLTAARQRAEDLLRDVRHHEFGSDGLALAVSVSAGVSHAPTHASELQTMYAAADAALYRAKQHGRNRVDVA